MGHGDHHHCIMVVIVFAVVVVVFVVVVGVVFCCSGGSSSTGSRHRRRYSRRSISNLVIESLRQSPGTWDSPNPSQTLQPQMSTYAATSRIRGVCSSLPCVLPPKAFS